MREAALLTPSASLAALSRDYLELSKARIVLMVLITTAAGYLVGAPRISPLLLFNTLLGTALVYSAAIAVAGTLWLGLSVNWLTAGLGGLTLTSYIFIYTPLKRVSTLCTIVGAVPGAIPPLMGWTAATGSISAGGWVLFAILFFWQLPHFMAISWIYREDYGRAGFSILSVRDSDGAATARAAVLYSLALLGVSVLPALLGLAGVAYVIGAVVAGFVLLGASIAFFFERSNRTARRLFMISNLYLMTVMVLLVVSARA